MKKPKRNRGFTLVELVVVMALAVVLFAGIVLLISTAMKATTLSRNLADAQRIAQDTMLQVEHELRYAGAVQLSDTAPDATFSSIKAVNGKVYKSVPGETDVILSPHPGFDEYDCLLSFSRVNGKVVSVVLTVQKDGKVLHTLESEIFAVNLLNGTVIGFGSGIVFYR